MCAKLQHLVQREFEETVSYGLRTPPSRHSCRAPQLHHNGNVIWQPWGRKWKGYNWRDWIWQPWYHHPQFHFPEPWSGTWKIKTENMQIRLSQVHDVWNVCMNWANYQHPTPTLSRVLRWEKENDRGRKCNLTCRRCTRCCKFAHIWHPSPYNYIFRSFEVGNEKGTTEEIEFDNLDTTTHNFIFPNLEVGRGK